ncbi:hypothetical protein Tco_0231910 [Tanacetum coccineum]
MDGTILYLVQCESLCRIFVFLPLTGCDRLVSEPRQAQLVDTDTKSEPKEASSEAEESQPLGSRVPLISEEFEASKLSDTRTISSHSSASSDSTAPLSPDHPLTHASPTLTPTRVSFHHRTAHMVVRTQPPLSLGMSARITEAIALSLSSFHKRYRSSYETPSPLSSMTLPIRKRYRGTSELSLDTKTEDESSDSDAEGEGLKDEGPGLDNEGHGLKDEGPGLEEEEEAAPEGQQQAVLVVDTAVDEPLGLGYGALRHHELASGEGSVPSTFEVDPEDGRVYTHILIYAPPAAPVQTPPFPEWSSGSLPVSPSSLLELYGSILHDHTQCLDALLPTLFEGYERDLRELYTRSGAVRDEIFSQRLVLALEAWDGQTDAQRAALWHTIYDIQRENHDLKRQIAEERHERLELIDCVARIERT